MNLSLTLFLSPLHLYIDSFIITAQFRLIKDLLLFILLLNDHSINLSLHILVDYFDSLILLF